MKWLAWVGITLLLLAIVLIYRFWQVPVPVAEPVPPPPVAAEPNYFRSGVPVAQQDVDLPDDAPEQDWRQRQVEALAMDEQELNWRAEQMRDAFLDGDDRAPPIAPRDEARQRQLPSAEELADPELYQQYEARQYQSVRESFVRAAAKQISDLEQQLQQAREMDGDPAQLAEGQDKLDRLRELYQDTLQESPDLRAVIEQAEATAAAESGGVSEPLPPVLAPDEDGPAGDDSN